MEFKNMIIINGVSYEGNNISVKNNKVFIDGVDKTPETKVINICVDSDVEKLSVDAANEIKIFGNVGEVKTMSGDVNIEGNVEGDVETMSGDVKALFISGKVKTMSGDITTKG